MDLSAEEKNLDPRVRRTRQLLEDALTTLLNEKSYAEITVKEIATQATVNRATFYAHFIDKDDLFKHFLHNSFNQVLSKKLTDTSASNREYVNSLLTAVFEYMDWLTSQCRSAKKKGHPPRPDVQLQAQIQDLLLPWVQQLRNGSDYTTIAPKVFAVAISSAVVTVAYNWGRKLKLDRPPPEDIKEQLRVMIFSPLKAASIDDF